MTTTYYKAILQKLHRQKFYLHRWILSKHQSEFLSISNDVPNWFSEGRNYKNRKGIVIQRLWVFEFRDPVSYFRDVSELRVPPNLRSIIFPSNLVVFHHFIHISTPKEAKFSSKSQIFCQRAYEIALFCVFFIQTHLCSLLLFSMHHQN